MINPLSYFSLKELQNLQDHNNRVLWQLKALTIWFWQENARTYLYRSQIQDNIKYMIPGSPIQLYWNHRLTVAFCMEEQSRAEYELFKELQCLSLFRKNMAMELEKEIMRELQNSSF